MLRTCFCTQAFGDTAHEAPRYGVPEFTVDRGLVDGMAWLQSALPEFFPEAAGFSVSLLQPSEEGEDDCLDIEVRAAFPAQEFRDRRHAMCEAMRAAGHTALYEVVGIYQRHVAIPVDPTLTEGARER